MSSITDQLRLRRKMKKLLNDRQNRSFLSEKNVICQDRKLRGRIIKPTDWNHRKIECTAIKKSFSSAIIEEEPSVKVIVPTEITMPTEITIPTEFTVPTKCTVPTEITMPTEVPMASEITEPAEGNVFNETIGSLKEANTKEPSQYAILYKAIQRLWHENLQVFIYHSDSVNFTNFIYSFPELIAVQIKIVVPSSSEPDLCQIISAKNYIFQKQAFLKMIDGTCDDTFTRHIIFILHGSKNEEPRTMRLPPNRHAIKMEFNKYSPNNGIEAIQTNNNIGPLDLRIQYSDGLEPSDILNRNIMNKLQRLNTVIRRVPEPKIISHATVPKNNFVYRSSNLPSLRSSQTGWKCGKIFKRKENCVERIAPQQYQNWQKNCAYNDKFVGFLNSYQASIIQSTSLIMHNHNSSVICTQHMKSDMWLSYASRNEIFDREVSLAELDAMPIATLFKPEEDFNLDDYML